VSFESGFSVGSVNGQQGWSATGGFDQGIVNNSSFPGAPSSFGTKSWRISDSVTSGSFGDQPFSSAGADAAGEPGADTGGFPTGTVRTTFKASLAFASTTPTVWQPGSHVTVSPDRGDGARMSYVRIEDSPTGFNLFFDDYQDFAPLGSGGNLDDGCGPGADNFIETPIATHVSRGAHTLGYDISYVAGPHNDVVKVSLDGNVLETGTTWEDYYRYCAESGGGTGGPLADKSRITRNLLFRVAGTADPANAGKGFLIDGVNIQTASLPTKPTPAAVVPLNQAAKVVFKAPTDSGGIPLTGYTITPYLGAVAQTPRVLNSTATTQIIKKLTNGKTYTFKIAARNSLGSSALSAMTGGTVVGAPGQPGPTTVTHPAFGVLRVRAHAPDTNGAKITGYTATCTSSNGGTAGSKSGSAPALTVSGLTIGKTYTCRMTAKNSRGVGPRSNPSTPIVV
jgi:hypothetical protein